MAEYNLLWAIALILVSLGLMVLETFIPSWGVIGFFAALSAIGGIVLAYNAGPVEGTVVLGASLVIFPLALYLGFKWWPHTPVGRRVLLQAPTEEDVLPDSPYLRQLKQLVGQLGRAKTMMLPSGPVEIDGRTVDCVSEGMPIEAGQTVKVIEVRGVKVVVRAVDEEPPSSGAGAEPTREPADRPLRPLGDFDLDRLDEE